MRSSRTLGTELWREIVERLDEGVVVFNQRGVAIYANDEAARLLNYQRRDVLELERDDLVALCDQDRMDGARFANVFISGSIPAGGAGPFEVVTASRHLALKAYILQLENAAVLLLMMRELPAWRSDLIAGTVATEMQGPLAMIEHYAGTLGERLKDPNATLYEIKDLARIVRESLERALKLWDWLTRLYGTDPRQSARLRDTTPVNVGKLARVAIASLNQGHTQNAPDLRLDAPSDLPMVRGSLADLGVAFHILFEQSAARLPGDGHLQITARSKERYVQVDLRFEPSSCTFHSHFFDRLPLAIAEQIIMQHGGRVWFSGGGQTPNRVSLSLPAWAEEFPARAHPD